MIALVTIIYTALVVLIYRVMKIRPTPWNIAGMVILGVFVIGTIVIFWKFSAPTSNNLIVSRYTVQLVPQVKGPITKIHAQPNVPLRGHKDLLFEIQKDTYQNTVDEISASLDSAEKNIDQIEASIIAADAAVKRAEATRAAAKVQLEISEESDRKLPGAVSALDLEQQREQLNAAVAAVDQANAVLLQANIGKQAAESTARGLKAQLANAEFNLNQCMVYAPADGFVTYWAVREGTMAAPLPLTQVGTFVDTTEVLLIANFPQNLLKNVKRGNRAELTFKTKPGRVYAAEVDQVIEATGEGQFLVSGSLPSAADIGSSGMLVVKFTMDDADARQQLAIGTAGTAVIYTDRGKPFHVISKVVVRMHAWMYYLNPF